MGTIAVDIQGVSKRFRLYQERYTSLKEKVIHAGRTPYHDLWALNEVSFDVQEGETVGVLGRNGSGKSTLLKCICGVLRPTSGQVVVRGKLAGLLELGAGFQPDLTGRENIYLNGSLLGMSKSEIARVFDDVVAFAELDQFIDNQVKFYSSGMYIRLGFAVAVNVDPDVLVIDEVLAVGDERFQRKCLDRVGEFQREGRTIIFVTHSPDQVRSICDRAVVLSDGRLVTHGLPGEAVRLFREGLLEAGDSLAAAALAPPEEVEEPAAPGAPIVIRTDTSDASHPVRLTDVTTSYPGSADRQYMVTGDPLTVRLGYHATARVPHASFVIEVCNEFGNLLVRTDSGDIGPGFDLAPGDGAVDISYDSVPLLDGTYQIFAGVESGPGGTLYDWREPAATLEVMNPGRDTGMLLLHATVGLAGQPEPGAVHGALTGSAER
jgi:ABC-2 type transport system ATP-binding protein